MYRVKVRPGETVRIGEDITVEYSRKRKMGRRIELKIERPAGMEISVKAAPGEIIGIEGEDDQPPPGKLPPGHPNPAEAITELAEKIGLDPKLVSGSSKEPKK